MNRAPFAYVITENDGWGDEVLAVGAVLAAAVGPVADRVPRIGMTGYGKQVTVTAYFQDGTNIVVPREAYAEPMIEPDEETLAFIRDRAAKIAKAKAAGNQFMASFAAICGIGRCNPDDPEDKQLADHRATAPWVWRQIVDETWWQRLPEVAA